MIDPQIVDAIDQLEAFQKTVDNAWNIPREEGMILHNLVLAGGCRRLVEVGTSYGFSGLFLGAAAKQFGGTLHTFDMDPAKHKAAAETFSRAGLDQTIALHTGDARETLSDLPDDIDFAFLDATKDQTVQYWQIIEPKLAQQCIVTVDNISTHGEVLGEFTQMLRSRSDFTSCPVEIGNGFELAVRRG